MIAPVIKAWEQSDGYLPEVHKAAIKVAFEYNDKYRKFQNPENWWLTTINMSGSTDKYPVSEYNICLLYTSPSPRDATLSRMPSSA